MPSNRSLQYETSSTRRREDEGADERTADSLEVSSLLTAGAIVGGVVFGVVYLVSYMLALANRAGMTPVDEAPSTWVMAGFSVLMGHGGTFQDSPDQVGFLFDGFTQLAAMILVVAAAAGLVCAGGVLGRTLQTESVGQTALAGVAMIPGYLLGILLLASAAEYSPSTDEQTGRTDLEIETLAMSIDSTLILSTVVFVGVFAVIGTLIGNREAFLERRADSTPNSREAAAAHPGHGIERHPGPPSSVRDPATTGDQSPSLTPDSNLSSSGNGTDVSNDAVPSADTTRSSDDHDRYPPDRGSTADAGDSASEDHDHDHDHDRYRP